MGVACFLLLSCFGLAITVQAQNCNKPTPGPNMSLKDEFLNQQSFPSGSTVSFVCDVGYQSAGGSPNILCTAGSWGSLNLKCERKNCGSVGELLNGQVDYPEGTEFGDKAVFACDPGYTLVGKTEIICQDQGWSGRLPVCEVVTCDPPPQIVDGTYSPIEEMYSYRSVIQYTCTNNDYTLNGSKSRSCSDDGTFKPDAPTCKLILCKDPAVTNANWIRNPPYKPSSTVDIQCSLGYTLKGARSQTCTINGAWSPGLPTCERLSTTTPTTTTTTKKPTDGDVEPDKPNGVGIGVGIGVGVVIGAAVFAFFMCKRNKNKKKQGSRGGSDKAATKDEEVALS